MVSFLVSVLGCLKGLEPSISGTTTRRFNQLSYRHHETEVIIPNFCLRHNTYLGGKERGDQLVDCAGAVTEFVFDCRS